MKTTTSSQPIGLFDSGIGGLTVAQEMLNVLPNEDLIYFGDTAHLPYGDKSEQAIINYTSKIAEFLLERHVKLIVIACNSASSVAYRYLREKLNDKVLVVNVIDPIVEAFSEVDHPISLGLIGTRRTVQSQSYQRSFQSCGLPIKAHATPLLAAAIEEGFAETPVMDHLIKHYLKHETLTGIDHLILGCTHYPLIKNEISRFYQANNLAHINVIDPSAIIAEYTADLLKRHDLLNTSGKGLQQCFLSDVTESFVQGASRFIKQPIDIVKYPLWD